MTSSSVETVRRRNTRPPPRTATSCLARCHTSTNTSKQRALRSEQASNQFARCSNSDQSKRPIALLAAAAQIRASVQSLRSLQPLSSEQASNQFARCSSSDQSKRPISSLATAAQIRASFQSLRSLQQLRSEQASNHFAR